MNPIGILALQGAFARHADLVEALGRSTVPVRKPEDLSDLSGMIIPGGESTTIGKLMVKNGLHSAIRERSDSLPIFGTCAGLILLAREITGQQAAGLKLIDIEVERNGFGRQRESFRSALECSPLLKSGTEKVDGVFIRAPRIRRTGNEVEVLARLNGEPVLVRQGNILAGTFHPELTGQYDVHRYFIGLCESHGFPTDEHTACLYDDNPMVSKVLEKKPI